MFASETCHVHLKVDHVGHGISVQTQPSPHALEL